MTRDSLATVAGRVLTYVAAMFLCGGLALAAIDIKKHGACKGDPDDSQAIGAAIAEAQNHQGDRTVVFSCLAPIQNSIPFDPNKPSVTLKPKFAGHGIRVTDHLPADAAALTVQRCNGCVVRDLTFEGSPGVGIPSFRAVLLLVKDSQQTTVTGNIFRRGGGGALASLMGRHNSDNTYSFNTIDRTEPPTRGMWIGNASPCVQQFELRPIITDNDVSDTAHSGIAIVADDAQILRNTVMRAGSPGLPAAGILLSGSVEGSSHNALVDSNILLDNQGHGFQSDINDPSHPRTDNITVTNNICSGNGFSGIYAVNADNWTIRGNTCENNNTDGDPITTGNGITISRARGVLVEDNLLRNTMATPTQTNGVFVDGVLSPQTPPDVHCVTIRGNTASGHVVDGILVSNSPNTLPQTVDSVHIESNVANNNARHGIRIAVQTPCGVSNVTLLNNTATGNGSTNIQDDSVPGCGAETCSSPAPPNATCPFSP